LARSSWFSSVNVAFWARRRWSSKEYSWFSLSAYQQCNQIRVFFSRR
jgi:hypothetical protein